MAVIQAINIAVSSIVIKHEKEKQEQLRKEQAEREKKTSKVKEHIGGNQKHTEKAKAKQGTFINIAQENAPEQKNYEAANEQVIVQALLYGNEEAKNAAYADMKKLPIEVQMKLQRTINENMKANKKPTAENLVDKVLHGKEEDQKNAYAEISKLPLEEQMDIHKQINETKEKEAQQANKNPKNMSVADQIRMQKLKHGR